MKKVYCFVLALLLVFTMSAIAESIFPVPEMKMIVNGTRLVLLDDNYNILPVISSNGVMYVPAKEFVESVGGSYEFDDKTNTATIELTSSANSASTSSPQKKKIEIASYNFKDYFDIRVDTSDHSYTRVEGKTLYPDYLITENVVIKVSAKYPMEIYNVQFELDVPWGTYKYATFSQTMPSSGMLEEKQAVSWTQNGTQVDYIGLPIETLSLGTPRVKKASGYIMVNE